MKTSLQMLSRRTEIWHIPADSSVGMQDATPRLLPSQFAPSQFAFSLFFSQQ